MREGKNSKNAEKILKKFSDVEEYIKIKVVLPKKYSTSKYTKYAKIKYVDGYGKKVYSISSKFKW